MVSSLTSAPFITVVMPVRNEEKHIAETLRRILEQDYPQDKFEVIVADGMSDDRTPGIVNEFSARYRNVRLIANPKRLSSAGRNIGFKNGRGDVFLVVDGHCHIENNQLLKNIAACFEKSGADCLGRPQPLDPPGLTDFQKAVAIARASKIGHSGDSLIYGEYEGYASPVSNGAAYRRDVFEKIGYVNENFDACEDVEFNYRVEKAGLKAYTSPKLTIRYYPREGLRGLFRQMMRYGRGRFRFVTTHPEAFTVETVVPPLFVVGAGLLACSWLVAVASGRGTWISSFLSAVYGFYLFLILAESFRLSLRNGFSYFGLLPFIFIAVHSGLGVGFVGGLVRGMVNWGLRD